MIYLYFAVGEDNLDDPDSGNDLLGLDDGDGRAASDDTGAVLVVDGGHWVAANRLL